MISLFSNSLGPEEQAAVHRVFESRWLGTGGECTSFEAEFAQHLGAPAAHTLLTNSCTAAIYLGLRALQIGPGDEVIISTVNFVACANAVLELGATPVFADVDPHTLNILPAEIDRLKTPRTKVVIILHYGGHPAPMREIVAACGPDIALFEDSANSISSRYEGQSCGTFGAIGTWSFDAMKILSMGDGGGLYVKDAEVLQRAKSFRFLGLAGNTLSGSDAMKSQQERWWEYDLDSVSGRFVSNDIAAAIGRVQLQKLAGFIQRRARIWAQYQEAFKEIAGLTMPPEPLPNCESSYYFYWLQLEEARDELAHYLAANGVYTSFRYFPLHLVKYYSSEAQLPNAEKINRTTLNLPLHQNLSDADVEKVITLVKAFFAAKAESGTAA